uniref:Asparagine synthetase domain-containing protein n=1 Tax=Meloidogyne hapla TaxID=6305 RepID=A0A1I8BCL0_MELHA
MSYANSQELGSVAINDPILLEEIMLQQMPKRGPMKKADVRDFIGSLNGASRLRYGKRAVLEPMLIASPYKLEMLAKRASNNYAQALPAGLLDQLNGAERLRFGRK